MKLSEKITATAILNSGIYFRAQGMKLTDTDIVNVCLLEMKHCITKEEVYEILKELEKSK